MERPPPLPTSEPSARPPPLRKKQRRKWKLLLLIIGIPLGIIAGLVTCGFIYAWTAEDLPVGETDRRVVFSAAAVSAWMGEDFEIDPSREKITKRKFLGGSYELEYEYEHPDESTFLYIYCIIFVESSAREAKAAYVGAGIGNSIGSSWEDVELEKRNDLFSWGSKSNCSLLCHEGTDDPFGNSFSCLKGRRATSITMSGIYFTEPEVFAELMKPVMERIDAYDP